MKASVHRSFWLGQVLDGEDSLSLAGSIHADIAIVGGGYTGLWTALRIKKAEPAADVVVLEADVCGAGASGRNGGLAHGWWEKLAQLIAICGVAEAKRLCETSEAAVDELERLDRDGTLPSDFIRGGKLSVATTPAQVGAWDALLALCERNGVDPFEPVSAAAARGRVDSPTFLGGVFESSAATVHPGKLVRGLRKLALRHGVKVYEHTPMRALERATPPRVHTPGGSVTADHVVVALGAWAAGLPEFHRRLYVVSSEVVVTPPIPEELRRIGWIDGESINDGQARVLYGRTTSDGRIALGRGGGRLAFGGRLDRGFDRNRRSSEDVAAALRRLYPSLAGLKVEHDWSGPIDRTLTGLPVFGRLGGHPKISYGIGWSGTGVAPTLIGGRILASIALDLDDGWQRCGLVEQRSLGKLPPEPIRYAGGAVVRRAVVRKAAREDASRKVDRLTHSIAGLVPRLPEA
ncbi:MAG: FAD-dependent oxidoreductase [Actinobacteria bacterium]|nr:FAD-dependent oxidoreductase [Actinomycetota bacterium]